MGLCRCHFCRLCSSLCCLCNRTMLYCRACSKSFPISLLLQDMFWMRMLCTDCLHLCQVLYMLWKPFLCVSCCCMLPSDTH